MKAPLDSIQFKIEKIRDFIGSSKGFRAQLLQSGLGTVAVKVGGMGIALAVAVVLARALGPRGYGIYTYVFTLVALMAIPARFGLPILLVRECARAMALSDWAALKSILRWALATTTVVSLALVSVCWVAALIFSKSHPDLEFSTFSFGLVLVPLTGLIGVCGAALSGLRKVVLGQLPEMVVRPGLFLSFIWLTLWFGRDGALSPSLAMALNCLAAAFALIAVLYLLRRALPEELKGEIPLHYEHRRWVGSALPLTFIIGMQFINTQTDILMLGFFVPAEDVGIYRVAIKGAEVAAFGLTAVGTVTMPYFARFYASCEMERLKRLATYSARVMFLFAVPAALIFIIFGRTILSVVFGPEYTRGYYVLVILSVAQVINASFGTIGQLLNMSGHERETARAITIAAISNIGLNFLFISTFGVEGAALATGLTLVVWNLLLWRALRRKLGVDSSIVGLQVRP